MFLDNLKEYCCSIGECESMVSLEDIRERVGITLFNIYNYYNMGCEYELVRDLRILISMINECVGFELIVDFGVNPDGYYVTLVNGECMNI